MNSSKIIILLLVFIGAFSLYLAIIHFPYTPDDTYIYLQYAKNIVNGYGISFNNGIPSYGCTGPLWLFLSAVVEFVFNDAWFWVKVLDILFFIFSALIFLWLLNEKFVHKESVIMGFCFFALDVWGIRWAGSGMETSFSLFVAVVILYLYEQKKMYSSLALSAILVLIRPEALLLYCLLCLDILINETKDKKRFVKIILPFSIVVLPWIVFSDYYFGALLPNTLMGKTTSHMSIVDSVKVFFEIGVILFSAQPIIVLLLTALPALIFLKKIELSPKTTKYFLWPIFLIVFYAVGNVQVVSRYLIIIMPSIVFGAIVVIDKIISNNELFFQRKKQLFIVAFAITILTNQIVYWNIIYPHTKSFQKVTELCLKPMAYWLKENSVANAKVIAPDVGIIGYYSDRIIYDPAGLITPQMQSVFRENGFDKGMTQSLYEKIVIPDYVIDRSAVKERLKSNNLVPIITTDGVILSIRNNHMIYYTLYKRQVIGQ